ncbi:MAG: hypothetical protein ACKVOU_13415 [Cytophagales bacterium]
MSRLLLFLILIVPFFAQRSYSQGCSDAGFCTMGAMRPNQGFSKKVNLRVRSVEFTQYYGLTTFGLYIFSYTADVNVGITNRLTAQIKMPYQFVFGSLGNTQGFGDVSISFTQNLISKEAYQLNLSVGTKIPTGSANITKNVADRMGNFADRPLPMYYQTTLGTYDVIAGVSFATKNWLFSTGIQIPLNKNGNQFLWVGTLAGWNETSDSAKAILYPKSRNLERGIDVMLRAERNFRFSNWNTYVGILAIYRLTKDRFLDGPVANGIEREINTLNKIYQQNIETDNFAITVLVGGGYRFNTKSAIKLMVGYRLVDRFSVQLLEGKEFLVKRNADGLARLFVTNIGYEYRF